MILGAGYAYWNPQSKVLYVFDIDGNVIKNSRSEICPTANQQIFGYIKEMDDPYHPSRDTLRLKERYQNSKDGNPIIASRIQDNGIIHNEIIISSTKKNKNMTSQQLKQDQPDLYNSVFQMGVAKERKRVNSWINSGVTNKWELRDGILSGLSYQQSSQEEVNNFYNEVQEKLDGNFSNKISNSRNQQVEQKEDYYSKLEAQDFYDEVDQMLKK